MFRKGHKRFFFVTAGLMLLGFAGWFFLASSKDKSMIIAEEDIPDGMVLVPAGYFIMGSDDPSSEPDEHPQKRLFLPAFFIDRYEVTNAAFKAVFPNHTYSEGTDQLPATHVTREQAMAYCRAVGKRLPTNAEWEKAARGTDGRKYPWGDTFTGTEANISPDGSSNGLKPVGSFPQGASIYGVHDMAGNAWEWVEDIYKGKLPWPVSLIEDPPEPRGILRGGAHGYGAYQARCSYQGFEGLEFTCNDTGFRYARDVSTH